MHRKKFYKKITNLGKFKLKNNTISCIIKQANVFMIKNQGGLSWTIQRNTVKN